MTEGECRMIAYAIVAGGGAYTGDPKMVAGWAALITAIDDLLLRNGLEVSVRRIPLPVEDKENDE